MTVSNFLNNKDNFTILQAREVVVKEAFGRNTKDSIAKFEKHYEQLIKDYYSDQRLALSSVSFELDKLNSFKPWLEELVQSRNIYQYMPFIVSKMLLGDPLAHSIFVSIYQKLGKADLLISRQTITNHPELKVGLSNSDAGANTKAIVNAEHWLNSLEGKEVLCHGVVYKDAVESLIGECLSEE